MPESQAQVRLAHAVISGGAKSSMPLDVAKEIVQKMHGRRLTELPEKARGKKKFRLRRQG